MRYKKGFACRCRACGGRKTIKHRPESYWGSNARHGKCKCGGQLVVDRYRSSGDESKKCLCRCMGYPFQHRRGSVFCFEGGAGSIVGFSYPGCSEFSSWNQAGRPKLPEIVIYARNEDASHIDLSYCEDLDSTL